ncbi:hypothetical protein OIO90_006207 [Microbotryomycetes sp. JL221]|nr:hypothetical protein OIO90_006207 [Microbotryomycetes sp. JL221]
MWSHLDFTILDTTTKSKLLNIIIMSSKSNFTLNQLVKKVTWQCQVSPDGLSISKFDLILFSRLIPLLIECDDFVLVDYSMCVSMGYFDQLIDSPKSIKSCSLSAPEPGVGDELDCNIMPAFVLFDTLSRFDGIQHLVVLGSIDIQIDVGQPLRKPRTFSLSIQFTHFNKLCSIVPAWYGYTNSYCTPQDLINIVSSTISKSLRELKWIDERLEMMKSDLDNIEGKTYKIELSPFVSLRLFESVVNDSGNLIVPHCSSAEQYLSAYVQEEGEDQLYIEDFVGPPQGLIVRIAGQDVKRHSTSRFHSNPAKLLIELNQTHPDIKIQVSEPTKNWAASPFAGSRQDQPKWERF